MQDGRDNRVFVDEDGKHWLTDGNGNLVKDEFGNNIPPTQMTKTQTSSGFTTYDTSQGHCPFCGRLTCRGSCFK